MSFSQMDDLGTLSLAALRYLRSNPPEGGASAICGAVAHMVPMIPEGFIRLLMYEVDGVLHTLKKGEGTEWVELMTVLRRVDRP